MGIFVTQVKPYDHIKIRQEFVGHATQAIAD
jgi:hypothetical protein